MVLETELSTCFWKAACIRTWPSGVISWAVTKYSGSGRPGFFSFHSAKSGWTSLSSPSRIFEVNSKAKTGSIDEEQPAMREIVPVGAMVRTVAFRIFLPL